jgi:hypothetical protein
MWEERRTAAFDYRVLAEIQGYNWQEVIKTDREFHGEEVRNFHSSPDIIRIITSRKMRSAELLACIGKERNVF